MTVGMLRKALEGVPDHLPVIAGYNVRGCAEFATIDHVNKAFEIGFEDEDIEECDEYDEDTGEYDEQRDMALWD